MSSRGTNLDFGTHLLLEAGREDRRAFEQVYIAYRKVISDYVASRDGFTDQHVLEDLVQEVFTRALTNAVRFRGDCSAKTYLIAIARNLVRKQESMIQRHHGPRLESMASIEGPSAALPVPENEIDGQEVVRIVNDALDRLTPKQRQAIQLVHLQQTPPAKLAGCSYDAFKQRRRRGMQRLRQMLKNDGASPTAG